MVLEEGRLSYVKQLVQFLTSDDRVNDLSEEHVQQMLEESVTQSLLELEKRFRTYTVRLQGEQDVNKWRNNVARMEGIHNKRLHQSQTDIKFRHVHREALRNCYSSFVSDLDLSNSSLLDELFAADVVSISDEESIKGRDTRTRQNEEFITYLVGRLTFDEFNRIFLPVLSKHHKHLADALISEVDKLEESYQESQCVACRVRKLVQLKRLATPLLLSKVIDMPLFIDLRNPAMSNNSKWAELRLAVSDEKIIDSLESKYPDFYREFKTLECSSLDCNCPKQDVVGIATAPFSMTRLSSEKDGASETCFSECYSQNTEYLEAMDVVTEFQFDNIVQGYKMDANPRGICLIINNPSPDDIHQAGFDIDEQKLTETFQKLQFEVIALKERMKAERIRQVLLEYSEKDHSNYDAFVCAILTYGSPGHATGSGGILVPIAELTSMFRASNCKSLAGKPKIFIIPSSRGFSFMGGLRTDSEDTEVVADEADFVLAYSNVEGYRTYGSKISGGHYINALTNVLDTQADQHDLLECLTMTNREVARRNTYLNFENFDLKNRVVKQVPAPVFTLTKKLHLTSDPLWPHAADKD